MPSKPNIPCNVPGCPELIKPGTQVCCNHKAYGNTKPYLQRHSRSGSDTKAYGHTWRKARKIILHRDPICKANGCEQPSNEVDHIVPLANGGDNSLDNLQGLCKSCHSKKTMSETNKYKGRGGKNR